MLYKILGADLFCQKLDTEIRYKEGDEESKLILMAKEMLSLYFHSPLNGVVDAEFPFRVPLVNPVTGERLEVVVVHETSRDQKDRERLFYLAKQVLKGIKSGVFFPRQSFMCKDCEYEGFCEEWEGNRRS
jgi:hypothetical protein